MTVRAVSSNPASPFYNANAPTLTGQVGSLTAVLDAVLVNGFTGFTALGWSINQTTTNKRGYKQNLTGSNNPSGMLVYVDDTGPGVGTAKEARVCGFETMSAITPAGTGQFPTTAQSTIGPGFLVIRKSNTADATVRNYTIVGNGQTFYLFIESGDSTVPLGCTTFAFGDFKSLKASDQYALIIIARTSENSGSSQFDALQAYGMANANTGGLGVGNSCYGHFAPRSWTGIGGSIRVGKPADFARATTLAGVTIAAGNYTNETQTSSPGGNVTTGRFATNIQAWPAPNGSDGSLALAPTWIGHNSSIRGYLPGLWSVLQDRPLGHNDAFAVSGGNMNGKSIMGLAIQAYMNSVANADNGIIVVETSDTWA